MQNSRHKNGLTFSKIAIKVKRDFNQAQQNQFTFNRFSLKVKTFRFKLNKIMSSLSTNFLSSSRDHLRYFQRNIFLIFKLRSTSTPNFSSCFNNSTFQGQDTNNVMLNVAKLQHQQLEYIVNNPNTLSTTFKNTLSTIAPTTVNKLDISRLVPRYVTFTIVEVLGTSVLKAYHNIFCSLRKMAERAESTDERLEEIVRRCVREELGNSRGNCSSQTLVNRTRNLIRSSASFAARQLGETSPQPSPTSEFRRNTPAVSARAFDRSTSVTGHPLRKRKAPASKQETQVEPKTVFLLDQGNLNIDDEEEEEGQNDDEYVIKEEVILVKGEFDLLAGADEQVNSPRIERSI